MARASGRLMVYGMKVPGMKSYPVHRTKLRLVFGNGQLGDRLEPHAAPVVVDLAPRRHAVESR